MGGNVTIHGVDDTNTLTGSKVKWIPVKVDPNGNLKISLGTQIAGEEQPDLEYDSQLRVTGDAKYSVQDVSVDGPTTIYAGACRLLGIYINTVLSAHTVNITDGGTTVITLPASLAAGTLLEFPGIRFTNMAIAPNASSTGSVVVMYREAKYSD